MKKLPKHLVRDLADLTFKTAAEKELFEAGACWALQHGANRICFVDGVDYQHEIGSTDGTVYASKAEILEQNPCSEDCGIVKCALIPLEWVHKQKLQYDANLKPGKARERQDKSLDIRIHGLLKKLEHYINIKTSGPWMDKINALQQKKK